MSFNKPCLDCGQLTRSGSRCESCAAKQTNQRNQNRPHYRGNYRARAKAIRDNAIQCWLCGQGYKADDPWTADHLDPGNPDSPLAAAHRSCNSRRGNKSLEQTIKDMR